jgi:uncharacterized protein (DUF433 family)
MTDSPYIEVRDTRLYFLRSRVPLEAIARVWREGHSPEEIRENFPTLTLAEVYGAVAYHLDHQAEVDRRLIESEADYRARRAAAEAGDPERYASLRQRLAEARARREASLQPSA